MLIFDSLHICTVLLSLLKEEILSRVGSGSDKLVVLVAVEFALVGDWNYIC